MKKFLIPLICITFLYVSLTILRDFRDNFNREIWDSFNLKTDSSIFTLTEIPIAIMVLLILGLMVKVRNNRKAFDYYHYILFFGIFTVACPLIFFKPVRSPHLPDGFVRIRNVFMLLFHLTEFILTE